MMLYQLVALRADVIRVPVGPSRLRRHCNPVTSSQPPAPTPTLPGSPGLRLQKTLHQEVMFSAQLLTTVMMRAPYLGLSGPSPKKPWLYHLFHYQVSIRCEKMISPSLNVDLLCNERGSIQGL
ncbi:hypothetical protein DPEC_G00043640 [Dallia pectoralis]|uniref:Uncharacterized protein n=1 Tax=Dallia pectoralis TaxID=75939 RepID=A0ACC2H9F9_DALPE|nr:hypothetical protein DPEC_G00043640 [Dallia pectoralis]